MGCSSSSPQEVAPTVRLQAQGKPSHNGTDIGFADAPFSPPPRRSLAAAGALNIDEEVPSGRLKFRTEVEAGQVSVFNKKAQPRKPLLKTSSYLGIELLALAKKHPALQPVAFMLGALTSHALSAKSLKLDAARIAKLLEQVEAALVKLGAKAADLGTLTPLQDVLDGAMKVLQVLRRPKTVGRVDPEVVAICHDNRLARLRDDLKACIEALNDSGSVAASELEAMANASFRESKALDAAIQAGQEVQAGDGTLGREPDSLLDEDIVEVLLSSPDASAMGPDDPGPMPTDATQPASLHAAIMHAQVTQMCAMSDSTGMSMKAFQDKWPLDKAEAERMLVVQQDKLVESATRVDVADIIEQLQLQFKAAYVGAYVVGWESNHLIHCRVDGALVGKEPGSVITQKGRIQARKFSLCQHTVHSDESIVRVPLQNIPECFDGTMFGNPAMCAADHGVAHQAQRLGAPGTDPLIEVFVGLVQKGGELIAAGMGIQHVGTCIRIKGQKVGTLCLLNPSGTWGEASQDTLVAAAEQVAARLAAAPGS